MKKQNNTKTTDVTHTRPALTMEDAKRVIEALRNEHAVLNDVQRALK
jgi:hypothetical protein